MEIVLAEAPGRRQRCFTTHAIDDPPLLI